jgi:hypothetical protein
MANRTALRSEANLSIVVIGNYRFGPITAEPCRAKTCLLRSRRSYFAPIKNPPLEFRAGLMVEAPGTAPGSEEFITTVVYRHSRCRHAEYMAIPS